MTMPVLTGAPQGSGRGEGEKAFEYYLSICPSAKKDHDKYRSDLNAAQIALVKIGQWRPLLRLKQAEASSTCSE